MPRYLISFDDGAMDHVRDDEWPAVAEASHEVVRAAKEAGVWLFGAGLRRQTATVVDTDGSTSDGPPPGSKAVVGGFSVVETATREEALAWAARIARGCRCPQEVRELIFDPES